MLKAFLTRRVLAAVIGSIMTTVAGVLAANGIKVEPATIELWQEGLIAASGVALTVWGGMEEPKPPEIVK